MLVFEFALSAMVPGLDFALSVMILAVEEFSHKPFRYSHQSNTLRLGLSPQCSYQADLTNSTRVYPTDRSLLPLFNLLSGVVVCCR